LPIVIGLHVIAIPRFGAIGAAVSTAGLACIGAGVTLYAVFKLWGIKPGTGTLLRSVLATLPAYGLALLWPAPGLWVVLKLSVLSLLVPLALLLTGEFSATEISLIRSIFSGDSRRSD